MTLTTSAEWSSSAAFNEFSSTPADVSAALQSTHVSSTSSKLTEQSNAPFQQTANHSWSDAAGLSSSIQDERVVDPLETDSPSLVITNEFQSDFYYLCPLTDTTSFSKLDQHKQLVHDVWCSITSSWESQILLFLYIFINVLSFLFFCYGMKHALIQHCFPSIAREDLRRIDCRRVRSSPRNLRWISIRPSSSFELNWINSSISASDRGSP